MSDELEQLRRKLEAAQSALAEAQARCARHDAEQQASARAPDGVHQTIEPSQRQWLAALNETEDLIFMHDRAFRILNCNKAYQRRAGIPSRQIIGRLYYEIFPKSSAPMATCVRAMEEHGDEKEVEQEIGDAIYRCRAFSVRDEHGAYLYSVHVLEDITEHRRAAESLRARDAYLTAIIENQPGLIWLKDVKGRFLATNRAFAVSCGRETQDVLGKTDFDIWPREAAEKYVAEDAKVMQAGRPSVVEELIHDNKEPKWFETFKAPIRDPQGNIIGSTGYARDITERKRAEEALRESEHELRVIFDGALDGIIVADGESRKLISANAAICGMLGYTREEIVHMDVSDLHPKQDLQRATEPFERMLRGEIQLATDIPMIRHDGSVFCADIKAAPIRLAGKTCLLGIFRDITERRQTERELVESEARFRGLVEQSITGIYMIQDGRFAYVNPRFAQIRGFSSADDMIGLDPLQLIAEKDRATAAENNRRLLAGEMPRIEYNFSALRKDGSSVDVGVHSAVASYLGRPAIIGLLQDISEKKRAEEQIHRYTAQLESAFMQSVRIATTLSEMRDPYTAGHERRVAEIAVAVGAELGFDARRQEGLRVAGYLHDIGKITIPSEILAKPGALSAIEVELIQGHAQASYDVLKDVEFPWPVAQVALQHHERMDGRGYPQGLKGEAILLDARIMAVADVVEAMSSHRPYRPGLGIDRALAEIERGRATAYDPIVADACLRLFRIKGYAIPA